MKIRHAVKCFLLAGGAAATLAAQEGPREILDQVSREFMNSVNRMAGLVGTVTMERTYSEPLVGRPLHSCDDVAAQQKSGHWRLHLASSDVVRADVLVGGVNDAYSWSGENRFADPDLESILRYGLWSAGDLAGLPHMIFGGQGHVDFAYDGDKMLGGRLVSEFEFHVNAEDSQYRFRISGGETTAAYEGRLLADPQTGDLVQLMVRTVGLPANTGTCEVTHTFDYAKVVIGGEQFVLPQILVRFSNPNGTEYDNRVTYSNFRRREPQPEVTVKAGDKATALPPGVFVLELTQPIDLSKVDFGDYVYGAVITGIQEKSGQELPVEGRIIKLLKIYGQTESSYTWSMVVRWYNVTHAGVTQPFTANLMPADTPVKGFESRGIMIGRAAADQGGSGESSYVNATEPGANAANRNMGCFGAIGLKPNFVFPKGALSIWKTVTP